MYFVAFYMNLDLRLTIPWLCPNFLRITNWENPELLSLRCCLFLITGVIFKDWGKYIWASWTNNHFQLSHTNWQVWHLDTSNYHCVKKVTPLVSSGMLDEKLVTCKFQNTHFFLKKTWTRTKSMQSQPCRTKISIIKEIESEFTKKCKNRTETAMNWSKSNINWPKLHWTCWKRTWTGRNCTELTKKHSVLVEKPPELAEIRQNPPEHYLNRPN